MVRRRSRVPAPERNPPGDAAEGRNGGGDRGGNSRTSGRRRGVAADRDGARRQEGRPSGGAARRAHRRADGRLNQPIFYDILTFDILEPGDNMAATIIDSRIFGNIFSSDAMRDVWSDENRTAKYIEVERALA